MIRKIPFFYDEQLRRFIDQIVKAFSGFQVQYINGNGETLHLVPCTYAQTSKQVATILANNSQNSLNSTPCISVYISQVEYLREETRPASVISTANVVERKIDKHGNYTSDIGDMYRVERLQPIPFKVSINVDVWTTNTDQKLQLFEQIGASYNRAFDIQASTNPLEWTARTTVMFEDLVWSNNSIPRGDTFDLEVMTWKYYFTFYLNQAAKVKKLNLIERVVTTMYDGDPSDITTDDVGDEVWSQMGDIGKMFRVVTTPMDAQIIVIGNEIHLKDYVWDDFIKDYGIIDDGLSKLSLFDTPEENGIIKITGTVTKTSDPSVLLWSPDIDTLPTTTLIAINAIIDPMKNYPGKGLPIPSNGTRYLITTYMGTNERWGINATNKLFAETGDIIEYNNGVWTNTFRFDRNKDFQVVKNISDGKLYCTDFSQREWARLVDGVYPNDCWRLEI